MEESRINKATQPYLIQNTHLLLELPEEDRDVLNKHTRVEKRKRGDILFKEGTFPVGAYHLISGKIKIYQGTGEGSRQTLYIYSDGDLIGYRQLIAGEVNPVSAAFLEDSVIQFIPAETFRILITKSPVFARNILSALASEFTVWMNRMTVFKRYPVRSRLALALLMLYQQYSLSGKTPGTITITRTDLAEFVGASLETIVRGLNTFKSRNIVQIKGRQIVLKDPSVLLELLAQEQ